MDPSSPLIPDEDPPGQQGTDLRREGVPVGRSVYLYPDRSQARMREGREEGQELPFLCSCSIPDGRI